MLAGLLIRGWAAGILEKDRELAVSGPYAFTRNPLYFGSLVIGLGAAAAGGVLWFVPLVAVFFAWTYRNAMKREAADLEACFADEYVRYRNGVPLFFPRPIPYRPSSPSAGVGKSFSLRRYVRNKEYEAALGAAGGFGLLILKAAGFLG